MYLEECACMCICGCVCGSRLGARHVTEAQLTITSLTMSCDITSVCKSTLCQRPLVSVGGSMLIVFVCALPIYCQPSPCHLSTVLSKWRHLDRPYSSFQARKRLFVGGGGARRGTGLRGAASRAGADRGQRLLAATPEG